jgi:hypothetical protein
VFLDECWDFGKGMMREIFSRTHDRWNAQKICASQGGYEDSEWEKSWKLSSQSVFCWQCQECGGVHEYAWEDLKYTLQGDAYPNYDMQTVDDTTCMVCSDCKHEYADTPKNRRMLARSGRYVVTNPNHKRGHYGYQTNALAVFRIKWSTIIHERIEAEHAMKRGDVTLMKAWKMKRMAKFWKETSEKAREAIQPGEYFVDDYVNGEKFEDEVYRFFTIDRQGDHYWACVRAWCADGSSYLLFYGKVTTENELRDIQKRYNVKPRHVFQDARWQSGQVYAACAKFGWVAIMGDKAKDYTHARGDTRHKRFYSEPQIIRTAEGAAYLVFFSNYNIKNVLHTLRTGGGVAWQVPNDIDRDWIEQIDTEILKDIVSKDGNVEKRWVRTKRDNHAWDCESMQVAAAMMVGILGSGEALHVSATQPDAGHAEA